MRRIGLIVEDRGLQRRLHLGENASRLSPPPAHNRSVFTLVGEPEAVKAATLALFDAALPAIDLRSHSGEHPRLGAIDVVPFVPIEGITMEQCVALAKEVAASIAERFGVPVYLYEE